MLLDVNVLLALSWGGHVHHHAAHERFADLSSWMTCPITEAGLVCLLMTERVVGRRVSGTEALDQLGALREVPGWSYLTDSVSLAASTIDLRVLMGRRQVTDLHLVNLAATNGVRLATFDGALRDSLTPPDRGCVEVWSAR